MYAFLAVTPIILAIVLMVYFKLKSGMSLLAAWGLSAVLSITFWRMNPAHTASYTLLGFLSAIDILLIVFAAIFLLNVLLELKFIKTIGNGFRDITQDRRIQILIIAWLFGSFIEGAAGFGTPGALAAPLLVGLGIPSYLAALAGLIANSAPVLFGAAGTPTTAGFGAIAPSIPDMFPSVDPSVFFAQLNTRMALTNIFIGSFVPFMVIASVVARDGKKRGFKDAFNILPLCMFTGLAFTLPSYAVSFLGPQLPSLVGAFVGLSATILAVKKGFLVPKDVYRFLDDPIITEVHSEKTGISQLMAWSPYALIAVCLVLSRLPWLPFVDIIRNASMTITAHNLFGFTGINWNWMPLNNPGLFPFLPVALLYLFTRNKDGAEVPKKVMIKTLKQLKNAAIALMFGVALVQIMRFTNYSNPAGELGAMTTEIATALAAMFGGAYLLVAPFIGMIGGFVAGSNTVSNIMFFPLHLEAAVATGLPAVMVLAAQSMGGAVGSMVSINNVVAVTATTNAIGMERKLLTGVMLPGLLYSFAVAAIMFVYLAIGLTWVA